MLYVFEGEGYKLDCKNRLYYRGTIGVPVDLSPELTAFSLDQKALTFPDLRVIATLENRTCTFALRAEAQPFHYTFSHIPPPNMITYVIEEPLEHASPDRLKLARDLREIHLHRVIDRCEVESLERLAEGAFDLSPPTPSAEIYTVAKELADAQFGINPFTATRAADCVFSLADSLCGHLGEVEMYAEILRSTILRARRCAYWKRADMVLKKSLNALARKPISDLCAELSEKTRAWANDRAKTILYNEFRILSDLELDMAALFQTE